MTRPIAAKFLIILIIGFACQAGYPAAKNSVAFESMRKVAEEIGDQSAQFLLGHMYATGQGTAKDLDSAIIWFRKASDRGHAEARLRLGKIYLEKKKYKVALAWFDSAADRGLGEAHYWIGKMALRSLGEPRNYPAAITRFKMSTETNFPLAYIALAEMYEKGVGVKKSYFEAFKLYTMASKRHDLVEAQLKLGLYYRDGTGVKKNLKIARKWLRRAATKGSKRAYRLLANLDKPRQPVTVKKRSPVDESVFSVLTDSDELPALKRSNPARNGAMGRKTTVPQKSQQGPRVQPRLPLVHKLFLKPNQVIGQVPTLANQPSEARLLAIDADARIRQALVNARPQSTQQQAAGRTVDSAQPQAGKAHNHSPTRKIDAPRVDKSFGRQNALRHLQAKAQDGDLKAKFHLGRIYEYGKGVVKNPARSADLIMQSAQGGLVAAQTYLARMYMQGRQVREDVYEAAKWFRKAAQSGDTEASFRLAGLYRQGFGLVMDFKKAIKWYRVAANRGHGEAQFQLGQMFAQGIGVAKDYQAARKWLYKAAEHGLPEAKLMLNTIDKQSRDLTYKRRKELATLSQNKLLQLADGGEVAAQFELGKQYFTAGKNVQQAYHWLKMAAQSGHVRAQYTLGQLIVSNAKLGKQGDSAIQWLHRAAQRNYPPAPLALGQMYRSGRGVVRNLTKSARFMTQAARLGHKQAQYVLGQMYHKGNGVAKSTRQALIWLRQGAQKGHIKAQLLLADILIALQLNKPTEYDNAVYEAVKWLSLAASKSHVGAQMKLARLFYQGEVILRDFPESLKWFEMAANQGNQEAQAALGTMYENGQGVAKDTVLAINWYSKAAASDYPDAQFFLAQTFEKGLGRPVDMIRASLWYRRAADQGHTKAQLRLEQLGDKISSVKMPDKIVTQQ